MYVNWLAPTQTEKSTRHLHPSILLNISSSLLYPTLALSANHRRAQTRLQLWKTEARPWLHAFVNQLSSDLFWGSLLCFNPHSIDATQLFSLFFCQYFAYLNWVFLGLVFTVCLLTHLQSCVAWWLSCCCFCLVSIWSNFDQTFNSMNDSCLKQNNVYDN